MLPLLWGGKRFCVPFVIFFVANPMQRHLQNPSWCPLEAGHHEGFCKGKWRLLWE